MPKYGIHHIVLKEAVPELYASGNSAAMSAADIIQAEMPSAFIGSIGPDLFFWGPDYEAVDKLYKLYKNIEDVVGLYNKIVQPIRAIKDAVVEPVEDLVETLAPSTVQMIRHLLEEIEETSTLFKAAIGTGLFAGVLEGVDLLTNAAGIGPLSQQFFQMFVPELQSNRDETQWYWFDMLHYRYTGHFAGHLVEGATSDRQKAFAFGYLSHIATDVTGHPFVNQVSGTTYRLNVQRHVTAENYMDTWKYYQYYGESINQTLFTRLGLPDNLPTDVGDLVFKVFRDTYADLPHPTRLSGDGFYTREQIDETYEILYRILKFMESQAIQRPEEPFSGVADILADALDAFSPPPSPPDAPSSMCSWEDVLSFGLTQSSRDCYEEFFEEVAEWLNYLGELVVWSLETLRNLLDLVLSLLLSLPISVLLAILYGIQLLCYQAYRSARAVLSSSGFVMPEPDELDSSIARNLITPFQCSVVNFRNFPSIGKPARNNLVCPVSQAEQPSTAAGFHPATVESTLDRFIAIEPFDEQMLRTYALARSPEQTRSLQRDRLSIGNARDFTAWMTQHANDPDNWTEEIVFALFANWNLDADRGYGYLQWRGTIPHADPFIVEDEEYI
jgi:hypothetical protein